MATFDGASQSRMLASLVLAILSVVFVINSLILWFSFKTITPYQMASTFTALVMFISSIATSLSIQSDINSLPIHLGVNVYIANIIFIPLTPLIASMGMQSLIRARIAERSNKNR